MAILFIELRQQSCTKDSGEMLDINRLINENVPKFPQKYPVLRKIVRSHAQLPCLMFSANPT